MSCQIFFLFFSGVLRSESSYGASCPDTSSLLGWNKKIGSCFLVFSVQVYSPAAGQYPVLTGSLVCTFAVDGSCWCFFDSCDQCDQLVSFRGKTLVGDSLWGLSWGPTGNQFVVDHLVVQTWLAKLPGNQWRRGGTPNIFLYQGVRDLHRGFLPFRRFFIGLR